jgi:hypothetical protein
MVVNIDYNSEKKDKFVGAWVTTFFISDLKKIEEIEYWELFVVICLPTSTKVAKSQTVFSLSFYFFKKNLT